MSELKFLAKANIDAIDFTLDVSHLAMSEAKPENSNMWFMFSTRDTSHSDMSVLKAVAN